MITEVGPGARPADHKADAVSEITEVSLYYDRLLARIQELRRQETFRRSVVEAAFDCVVTINEQEEIIDFNPAAERTLGYKSEEVIGRTLAQTIIPERYRNAHAEGLARYLRTG